ncbi:MAG: anaerobic sulfatase maturase [Eubacterium sp.]|nr:anaerobic sulfatase maturase [Eubacterium sp.]
MFSVNLLIKPSSSLCNLKCEYCFYNDISQRRNNFSFGFMSEETIENVIKKAVAFSDRELTLSFQGGEPTLIGLDFYKKVIEIEKKYNTKNIIINNALQTNGVGIEESWADFFNENNFLIGISLDGIKETHNKNRSSFDKVMKTVGLFKSKNVQFNILTVVNNETANRAEEIYRFYRENGFDYIQFIPCIEPYEKENQFLDAEKYGKFLTETFNLWYEDINKGREVHIRQFENYIEMLFGYPPESCGMSGICSIQYVVEADGGVYPCDFYVLDEYKLGNLNSDSFSDIDMKRRNIHFIENSYSLNIKCRDCRYFSLCRGGCMRYRTKTGMNVLCEGYEIFFDNCFEKIKEIAGKI